MIDKMQWRIVVADDEAMQRNVLKDIIQKLYSESEVIACSNGKEVYDILTQMPVDIVLTDIRMPILGGMELIKLVATEYPKTKVILISAYQEFEYAQNAIKYKVVEYLIKPFRVSEVQKLLEKVTSEIYKENENENSMNKYQQLASKAKKQEEYSLLQSVLDSSADHRKLEEEHYTILQDFGTLAVLRWRTENITSKNKYKAITKQQEAVMKEHIAFLFPHMFILPQSNSFDQSIHKEILFLPKETALEVSQKLEYCFAQLKEKDIIFWAGLSNTKLCLAEEAGQALVQAEEMLAYYFYEPNGGVFSFDKMHTFMDTPTKSTTSFENHLRRAIRNYDLNQITLIINDMKVTLSKEQRCYPNKIKHRVSSIIVMIVKELENEIPEEQFDLLLNRSYQMYADCDSFEQLFEISLQLLSQALECSQKEADQTDAVEECIAYIKTHLDSDLSLQRVADYIHFHPNYLSARIKEKVGLSYSAFVLQLKMELASRLLLESNLKIQEIAQHCGFNDSNYFNRMFRREYNISPEQYRKAHKKW